MQAFEFPARFQTERLAGRCPCMDDVPGIFDGWAQDAVVAKYMAWRPHTKRETMEQWIASLVAGFGKGSRNEYVLTLRESDKVPIGMISIRRDGPMASFGYVIRRDMWGKGFAPEALRHLVEWALAQDGLYRAWALCDVSNSASARVMEKVGMKKEGVLHSWALHPNISPTPRDVFCYAKVK